MRCYWSEMYAHGGDRRGDLDFFSDGYLFGDGMGDMFSPAMLVTGVKLEEVVLNAVLV